MYKALAFDMDGTLLNKKHVVSETNKRAVKHAQEQGVEVVLASGRAPFRMESFAKELGIN